jgi:hypothetical protein
MTKCARKTSRSKIATYRERQAKIAHALNYWQASLMQIAP